MLFRTVLLIVASVASLTAQQVATVQVTRTPSGSAVPEDFMGLSFQQNAALTFFGPSTAGNYVLFTLMRNLGRGNLRIGGAGADESCWKGETAPDPSECQYYLTSADFESWCAASAQTGWKMLVGVNLVQNIDPGAPAYILNEITKGFMPVLQAYSRASLLGFELGNELNLYAMQGYRPSTYGVSGQITDLLDYSQAFKANSSTASISLAAPAYYDPSTSTVTNQLVPVIQGVVQCAGCSASNLGLITLHEYPLNNTPAPVTVSQLLAPSLLTQETQAFGKAVNDVTSMFKLNVQIDETNSVSPDPGQTGVSDVQASGIWALDFALQMAHVGIRRMNFHFHYGSIYNPILISNSGPGLFTDQVQPEYYGLYALNAAKGQQFLPIAVSAGSANIRGYALSTCATCAITVYLINKDTTAAGTVLVSLSTPATTASYVQLTAPSLTSTSEYVTYGGVQFSNTTGMLTGPVQSTPVSPDQNGNYTVPLPNATVTILTIQP
jgi:hypothetical protein